MPIPEDAHLYGSWEKNLDSVCAGCCKSVGKRRIDDDLASRIIAASHAAYEAAEGGFPFDGGQPIRPMAAKIIQAFREAGEKAALAERQRQREERVKRMIAQMREEGNFEA
jgi:hypothetical protein